MQKQALRFTFLIAAMLMGRGHGSSTSGSVGDYAHDVAQAKRAGLPVTMAQLQAKLPPASQNAAPLYTLLTQRLHDKPLGPYTHLANDLSKNAMPSAQELGQARVFLVQRTDLLRLVHQAAARPQCVFVRDWNNANPLNIQFPELAVIRTGARLLTAESLIMAERGQGVAAVHNEALGFRIARHASSDRTVTAYLIGVAADAITLAGFRKIIYISHGDPRVARAVQQSIDRDWKPQSLASFMRSEVAFQQGLIAMLRRTGPSALDGLTGGTDKPNSRHPDGIAGLNRVAWEQFLDADGSYLLHIMPQAVAAADQPYPQAHASMQAIRAQVDQPKDLTHLLAVIMFPAGELLVQRRAQIEARASTTKAAAALLSYRSSHGMYPATLGQALSPVPLDPYDGQPLRYKLQKAGFVVYSVGPDGRFDGGTACLMPASKQTLFRYPLPPYYAAHG